jgi:lambda repressor-like predicted transcriptional regulator
VTSKELQQVKANLIARGYSLAGYARKNGFHILTFRMWLRGTWGGSCKGKVSAKYEAAVIADGFTKTPTGG